MALGAWADLLAQEGVNTEGISTTGDFKLSFKNAAPETILYWRFASDVLEIYVGSGSRCIPFPQSFY